MKLLLIGPPACGKGTIGLMLSEKYGIPLVSSGQLLRDLPESFPWYKEISAAMDAGDLAPNDKVALILENELKKDKYSNGFVLDGWGRRLSDIELFNPGFDKVIFINIADESVVKRISGRRMCDSDGKIYNVYTLPKEELEKCTGNLIQRDDDKEEVVQERLRGYHDTTEKTINYFKQEGVLVEIDGEPIPEVVFESVVKAIGL